MYGGEEIMILLKLFVNFVQIGLFTFGGGYAMIPLIREKCILNGWLTGDAIMNFIAVSESTPGPIAVNMATFVGSSQAGFLGAFFATLGVVLPSFIIILIIVAILKNLLKFKGVQAFLEGVRPVVIGLILATAITTFLSVLLGFEAIGKGYSINHFGILIFAIIVAAATVYKKIKKSAPSPILLILFSAVLGIIFYM